MLLWTGENKNVEDIKIGDILIGNDGTPRNVLNLHNGVDKLYKIKQETREEYIVNSEHLLSLKYTNKEKIYWDPNLYYTKIIDVFDKNTLTTKLIEFKEDINLSHESCDTKFQDFIDRLDYDNTLNISIKDYLQLPDTIKNCLFSYKIEKPVEWEYKKTDVDPYDLGLWLGNSNKNIVDYPNDKLKKYSLLDTKFIPKDFIYNSKLVRLSVLAGLIDIDSIIVNEDTPSAIIKKDTTILLSQPYDYRQILVNAKFIADSLGFQTFLKNENLLSLNVSDINIRDISKLLKKKKYTPSAVSNTTWEKIQVEELEIGEYYGFEVDNNNLFVLPDFTVVHNCEFTGRTVIGPDPTLKMGQLGMPKEVAQILTIPEQVTNFNYDYLTKLVNDGKVNIVKKKDGERINIHHHIYNRGTRLNHGDIIIRKDEKTGEEFEFENNNGKEILKHGDKLKRNGELIKNIKYPEKRIYHLNVGDICERQLQNGDIVLLNRQPTLHVGSMMAQEIVIHNEKTFRFNLSIAKSFNADFDGDEMNVHVAQSLEAQAELRLISASKNFIISAQSSKPNMCIVQDSLLGAYRMTKGLQIVRKDQFYDISMKTGLSLKDVQSKIQNIRKVFKEKGKKVQCFHGKGLISLALPNDLNYEKKNNVNPDEPIVKIYKGVLYEGTLDKSTLGAVNNSLIQIIHKEYGPDITASFIDCVQFVSNSWLLIDGFSIGIGDCLVQDGKKSEEISDVIKKCLIEAETIKSTTSHSGIREVRIIGALSKAKDIGLKIAKDSLDQNNNFLSTVKSGSKGDYFNVAQITGLLGQQNLLGQRINPILNNGKRTLPHYPLEDLSIEMEYESRGFIDSSFISGLNPRQFYFHAMSGREGCCDKMCHKQVVAFRFFVIPNRINNVRQKFLVHTENI